MCRCEFARWGVKGCCAQREQTCWEWVSVAGSECLRRRSHVQAGEVHRGLLGWAKQVDFILMAKGLPSSAKGTLGTCSEGSSRVSPRLEITSVKRLKGTRAWPEGISGKATGIRGAQLAELRPEPRTPGLWCSSPCRMPQGRNKATLWSLTYVSCL